MKPNPRAWLAPPAIASYVVAVLSVAAALIVALGMEIVFATGAQVSLFLCAVMFSAWFGGIRPGLVAIVLSTLAFAYYFLPPTPSLAIDAKEVPRLLCMYELSACFVGALGAAQRSTVQSLKRTRDDQQQALLELMRVNERAAAMERKLRLAQRLEAMGTLAGGIAHDFNNILGAILGYGEMALRRAPKGSRLRRNLDGIMTAGERGRALVARVLAFSRSGQGERVAVPVEKVVREALELLAAKLPEGIRVETKLRAGQVAILGDPTQVHQVLMNLGTNAVQAMPAGGTLGVSLESVRIETPRVATTGTVDPGEYLVLAVADSGVGMPAEVLERIFDPFFTTKEVGVGTGLGLSLVHGIVTELGGAIDVASVPGEGSEFTAYLPRSGEAVEADEAEAAAMPRGDGQRVLIVDDEEPLASLASRTLEELGYVPTGFTSSSAALAAFRADPSGFDAVITDERMPGMTGSALIRELRGIRREIPILLMSGYLGADVARRGREADADDLLKKPVAARELAISLARVLRESGAAAPSERWRSALG